MKLIINILCIIMWCNCNAQQNHKLDLSCVQNVDLDRYLGSWYEIARFDHSFERGLTHVKAEYQPLKNGFIRVINSGKRNGERKYAYGKAKVPNKLSPGHLKVSFFWIFYADYYILELDRDSYSYALIGSSSDKYLWILSRTEQLPQRTLEMLLARARQRGYDTRKLVFVNQK